MLALAEQVVDDGDEEAEFAGVLRLGPACSESEHDESARLLAADW